MRTRLAFLSVLVLVAACAVCVADVPQMINYQGKLLQPSGAPVPDGGYNMQFAIYDVPTGGVALWFDNYSSVQVKNGLFSVLLGSAKPITETVFASSDRYFGLTVGADPEMVPRQKIASVAFAQVAKTVVDASITATKIADTAITTAKIADQAVTTAKIADGAITAQKLVPGAAIPSGVIVMWSGSTTSVPSGWALCDGTNGTPDLKDRFVVSVGPSYAVGAVGGVASVTLTAAQMPSHNHGVNDPGHSHPYYFWTLADGGCCWAAGNSFHYELPSATTGASQTGISIQNAGGGQAHENRPPYYALAFIMKLP